MSADIGVPFRMQSAEPAPTFEQRIMAQPLRRIARRIIRTSGFDIVNAADVESLDIHLEHVIRKLGVNCIIDVGAHFGEFALFLRGLGYSGVIVSIEPVDANFAVLRQSAQNDDRWRVHHLALGATRGEARMNVTSRTEMSSFLAPSSYAEQRFGESSHLTGTQLVSVQRLDDVFDELTAGVQEPHVLLKLDTQGYDLEVLAGAEGALKAVSALQFEASVKSLYQGMPSLTDSLGYAGRLGFELTGVFPVTRDHDDLRVIELDCVMIRPEMATNSRL